MIKYFCDRCSEEISEYVYKNDSTLIQCGSNDEDDDGVSDFKAYTVCNRCRNQFDRFIKGDKTEPIERK